MQVQVTISRAHKIADRLKERINDVQLEIRVAGCLQSIARLDKPTQGQLDKLKAAGQKVMTLSTQLDGYLDALTDVRQAIGQANHACGINDLLTRKDAIQRKLNAKNAHLGFKGDFNALSVAELEGYTPSDEAYRNTAAPALKVQVAPSDWLVQIETEIKALQREAIVVADAIAEANAKRIALTLPDAIANEVTGA